MSSIDATLIVPASGRSSRYPGMRPKWMLTHPSGKIMIQAVLESFGFRRYKKTVVVILREHCEKYEADIILEQIFGQDVEVLVLESATSCCPETVSQAISTLHIAGRVVIKDTDCIVEIDSSFDGNYIVGLQVDSRSPVNNLHQKSFIVKNEDDIVIDIVEKVVVSDNVCLGVYSVDADQFVYAYRDIAASGVHCSLSEIYVSHVISHLVISKKCLFHVVEATRYVDWGTLADWSREKDRFKTYIFDIDGVMLVNYGKYGSKNWSNTFEPIEENFSLVKKLSDEGNEIIFMTSREEEYLTKFKDSLLERGIKYKTILFGCNHNKRILVNDFAPTNPYPSCESVSIKRNSLLEDYI